ncbi:hypothetical protein EGM87_22640 [Sphingobium sp. RSMS]|nr:hypothetical protein [Sphingobium sp. RSMS]UXC93097.1 hypothetical protein EGM87_22640 [Sphingobium sp. RSMS]
MTESQKGPFYTRRRSRDWPPFQPTEKKPGEWEQTRDGFVRKSA